MTMKIKLNKERVGWGILTALAFLAIGGVCLVPPIEQDQLYHNFSDSYEILNISNFWNVISNIPFAIVGIVGLINLNKIRGNTTQYLVLFIGIVLVSIGSGYYHLNPTNSTLIWDRLPMTVIFMSLVSIIISEFFKSKLGIKLLFPLIIVGFLSILHWWVYDDLRFYSLVQFYPMFAIPVVLICFKSKYNMTLGYWLLLIAYIIAKFCEIFDKEIFSLFSVISGHTLKHIISAIGLTILVYTYIKRHEITLNTK